VAEKHRGYISAQIQLDEEVINALISKWNNAKTKAQ
jgi:hypothetical protein